MYANRSECIRSENAEVPRPPTIHVNDANGKDIYVWQMCGYRYRGLSFRSKMTVLLL